MFSTLLVCIAGYCCFVVRVYSVPYVNYLYFNTILFSPSTDIFAALGYKVYNSSLIICAR